jgi:hypothetical protein
MHTTRCFFALTILLAVTGSAARAADTAAPAAAQPAGVATPPAATAAPAARKLQVGLSFVPMGMGKYIYSPDAVSAPIKSDAAFAYGVGLSAGYEILPRLVVGVAPQVIFNVKEKAPQVVSSAVKEYDLLARIAYVLPVVEGTSVYAEVLPGFSVLTDEANSNGAVVAFGLGGSMNVSERVFVDLAAGYQVGFQKWSMGPNTFQSRTRFVRVALGGGVRF